MSTVVQKSEFCIGNARVEILMQGGFSEQGIRRTVGMHCHPNFEVHYIEEGEFRFGYGDTEASVKKDTLVIIPPKVYHTFQSGSENLKRLSFEFRITRLKNGSDIFSKYDRLFSSLLSPICVQRFIPEFVPVGAHMGIIKGEEELCRLNANFVLIFLKICDILQENSTHFLSDPKARTAQVSPFDEELTLIRILNHISSSCRQRLMLSDVAKAVNLSERQVQRILSARMGKGFHSILTENRVTAAKELMTDKSASARSLEDIAYACGFSNYVSFWSQFKRATGETPEQYRSKRR